MVFYATGGTVYTDGLYTVHVLTENDTFECVGVSMAAVLVVGAGGGGAFAGGGGGEVHYVEEIELIGPHSVTVGVGGAGDWPVGHPERTPHNQQAGEGGASSFDDIVCAGGTGGWPINFGAMLGGTSGTGHLGGEQKAQNSGGGGGDQGAGGDADESGGTAGSGGPGGAGSGPLPITHYVYNHFGGFVPNFNCVNVGNSQIEVPTDDDPGYGGGGGGTKWGAMNWDSGYGAPATDGGGKGEEYGVVNIRPRPYSGGGGGGSWWPWAAAPSGADGVVIVRYLTGGEAPLEPFVFSESQVGETYTVVIPSRPHGLTMPPATPSNASSVNAVGGLRHLWNSSVDDKGRMPLAYFVDEDNSGMPKAVVWETGDKDYPSQSWLESLAPLTTTAYKLRAIDQDLNISSPSGIFEGVADPAVWAETQPWGDVNKNWYTCDCDFNGSVLLAGASSGRLYLSINGGWSWAEQQPAGAVDKNWNMCACDADGSVLLAGASGGRLYLSTNGGRSWIERQPAGAVNKNWSTCASSFDGSVLLAGVYGGRLYLSINGGSSWIEQSVGVVQDNWNTCACDSDGSVLLAGAYGGRLYLSTNGGATWAETRPAANTNRLWHASACDSNGSVLLAGASSGRLFLSTNGGTSWTEQQPAGAVDKAWHSCAVDSDGSVLLAGSISGGRLYLSIDGGANWTEQQPVGNVVREWYCCASSSGGSVLLVGDYNGRLYVVR